MVGSGRGLIRQIASHCWSGNFRLFKFQEKLKLQLSLSLLSWRQMTSFGLVISFKQKLNNLFEIIKLRDGRFSIVQAVPFQKATLDGLQTARP